MWHPLRRLDRFILIHKPLVWRTRLLYFLLFSAVVANAALYLLGSFQPVAPAGVPNVEAVRVVGGLVYIAGFGVLAYWVYVQFRIPLPESGARRYFALTLLHAACALTILVNGFAYQAAIVPRIAAVVPDDVFADEYAYHASHRFWLCGVDREEEPVHRRRIDASLQAWGLPDLAPDFEPGWYSCDGVDAATIMRPPLSTLRDRMESVRAAKALRDGEPGPYTSFASVLPGFALLSLLFGAALLPAFVPASAWKRRFVRTEGASQRFRLQLPPHPSWLRRLDRSLVASHPLVWSLQLHTLGFALLVYAVLPLIALLALVSGVVPPAIAEDLLIGAIIWAPLAAFLLWVLVERRIELQEPRLRGNRTALAAYNVFVMAVTAPLVALVAVTIGTAAALALLFVMVVSGNYAAAWVYVAKYLFTGVAGLILLGSLASLSAAGFLASSQPGAWLPMLLWIVATGLVARHELRHAGPTRPIAIVAGAQILLMPAAALVGWLLLFDVIDPETAQALPIMLAAIPLFLLLQVFLAKPAMHTLIRYRYWPHSA